MQHDHDHQTLASPALIQPPNVNMATVPQTDAPSPHRRCDQCAGLFQVSVPSGASIFMNGPAAGTSMALNIDVDPCSGTPVLSGRAINPRGDIMDVHPCGCDDPLTPRHKLPLPRTPDNRRSGARALDPSHLYPSPQSPQSANRRPPPIFTHTRTPLVHVQILSPELPSASEPQLESGPETPTPVPSADPLGSPITPTPASMQRISQASSGETSFHTAQTRLAEALTDPAALDPLQTSREAEPQPSAPPQLDTIPPLSSFTRYFETPQVASPSPFSQASDISGPSAIGPLPSSPSYTISEVSFYTLVPNTFPVGDGLVVEEITLPLRPEAAMNPSNDGAEGPRTQGVSVTPDVVVDSLDHGPAARNTDTTSDIYAYSIIAGPPMPVASASSDRRELRFDLTAKPGSGQANELAGPSEMTLHHSGQIEGTWVAKVRRDRMALKLDLSLVGLGFQNLSLSTPDPGPPASPSRFATAPLNDPQVPPMRRTPVAADGDEEGPVPIGREPQGGWDVESNSSQSIMTFGSCPSIAPPLSDHPLTPIPELLRTPTRRTMSMTSTLAPSMTPAHRSPGKQPAHLAKRQNLASRLPSLLDNEPILEQLAQGENDVGTIKYALCHLANVWQNVAMMPDGVALRDVEDDCTALYHALVDLSPIIVLTWPQVRQPSLGTEGRQRPEQEQLLHMNHLGEMERKWYLKQHEFTTSLQRNLTRLSLLAQRVREDPDASYRGNVLERMSQFTAKFEDIALRLKLAHLVRVEQKCRARVRHSARRAVDSPEQAAVHEYHKGVLCRVREDIEGLKLGMRSVDGFLAGPKMTKVVSSRASRQS